MNKLIKLTDDHYVVVDDSEIKSKDMVLLPSKQIQYMSDTDILDYLQSESLATKKITHSTQPLGVKPITDKVVIQEDKAGKPLMSAQYVELDMSCTVKPLSLQEVKELIGEVDVEKKVRNEMGIPDYILINSMSPSMQGSLEFGINCYNQCLEDNKDKKYTEEDLRKAIEFGYDLRNNHKPINSGIDWVKILTQSLQPKTEWEVEIVDGKLKLKL